MLPIDTDAGLSFLRASDRPQLLGGLPFLPITSRSILLATTHRLRRAHRRSPRLVPRVLLRAVRQSVIWPVFASPRI